MSLPNTNLGNWKGFLGQVKNFSAFKLGDMLDIRYNESDVSHRFRASVISDKDMAPAQTVAVKIQHVDRDHESQEKRTEQIESLPSVKIAATQDITQARAAIRDAKHFKVSVRPALGEREAIRVINALRAFQESKSNSAFKGGVLGTDMDNMQNHNFFETLKGDQISVQSHITKLAQIGQLNNDQRLAFDSLSQVPGGIQIFDGPDGTGKTETFVNACMPLLFRGKPDGTHHRVLMLGTMNHNLDDITRRIKAKIDQLHVPGTRKPTVMRLHAVKTEHQALLQQILMTRSRKGESDFNQKDIAQLKAATSSFHITEDSPESRQGRVEDVRFRIPEDSCGYHMAGYAGLLEDDPPEERSHFPYFRSLCREFYLDDEKCTILEEKLKHLRDHTIRSADVLVPTVSNAATKEVHQVFKPDVGAVDEAERLSEGALMIPLGLYHSARVWTLIGDSR